MTRREGRSAAAFLDVRNGGLVRCWAKLKVSLLHNFPLISGGELVHGHERCRHAKLERGIEDVESDQCPTWRGTLSAMLDMKLDDKIKSLEHKVDQVMHSNQTRLDEKFVAQSIV